MPPKIKLKEVHFKIFEFTEHQMLVQKQYNDEKESFGIGFIIIDDGVRLAVSHEFGDNKKKRDIKFVDITEKIAFMQYRGMLSFLPTKS